MDSSRPRTRADLLTRVVDDDFFVYDPVNDRILHLNPTSALIFELCDGTLTHDEIADEVAATFARPASAVRDDVARTVSELVAAGFVTGISPG